MRREEEAISRMLKKALPSAQREEEAGRRVFYRLLLARSESPAVAMPNEDEDDLAWKPRPRLSMAVGLTAVAASVLLIAVLVSGFWRRAENITRAGVSRDPVTSGEMVRADGPDSRMLVLPDGSQVEMRSQSQLRIGHADDGLRVHLNSGSVIVTAAKQRAGHLYVETKDAMVSVIGTVFVVSVEQAGSRAGVIEGIVNVQYGANSQQLTPGQQVATSPAMEPGPLEALVSWSRRAAGLLALLRQPAPPALKPAAAAAAAPSQRQPAQSSQNTPEPRSLLIMRSAGNGAAAGAGQRSAFGNDRPAVDAPRPGTAGEAERAMEQALTSREPITDLSFQVETNYFQSNRAEYFVPVTLKIPGTQLTGSENAKRISLYILGEAKDAFGTTIQNFRDAIDVRLTDETAKELPMRQVVYEAGLTLLSGPYSIKFLVRDGLTGRIGIYQTAMTVPNLNKETGVPISSVVLSGELINLNDALSNAMQSRASPDSRDPLLIEGRKLIPSGTRTFSNRSEMLVLLQAYESNATEPLTAFVTIYRGETKVLETSPLTVKDEMSGGRIRALPVRLRVPLSTLPAGAYDCQVTILNPATQKSAVWRSPINVVN